MSQAIVNLTLSVVTEKINGILETYPRQSIQQIQTSPELRQKLVSYVLRRLPTVYITVENDAACGLDSRGNCYSGAQQEEIHQLIHEGIEALRNQTPAEVQYMGATLAEAGMSPSSWFG